MRRGIAWVLLILLSLNPPIAAGQSETEYFQAYYRELEGLPQVMLIADLEYQVESLLRVNAAAPPDLRYKIEEIKMQVFQSLEKELCAESRSAKDKRGAATRSLVSALAPRVIGVREKGEIAATLVRIVEIESTRYCL